MLKKFCDPIESKQNHIKSHFFEVKWHTEELQLTQYLVTVDIWLIPCRLTRETGQELTIKWM